MTAINIHHVETPVHGRVLVAKSDHEDAPLLVSFHGYGENADDFLRSVLEIPGVSNWHVAAIQALHPFYDRKSGTVVANWMTSQDRELAIKDNLGYVSTALKSIKSHVGQPEKIGVLGFSQGTAMAYRMAFQTGVQIDAVIALGGDVPPEITDDIDRSHVSVLIGRGLGDRWYSENKLDADVARLALMGIVAETCLFEGGHEWTPAFRAAAGAFLSKLTR